MVERRSKMSIMLDMLRTVESRGGSAKSTHILYGANLSHDRLKKHLAVLEAEGMLVKAVRKSGTVYQITKKGLEFLSGYNKMKSFFDAFGFSV